MVVDMEEGDLGELALENHDELQQEGCLLADNSNLPDNSPWLAARNHCSRGRHCRAAQLVIANMSCDNGPLSAPCP